MIARDINRALQHSEEKPGAAGYGPMALSKSSLVHLMRKFAPNAGGKPYHILELGGGQSTLFFQSLLELELLSVKVTTVEHHAGWVTTLQGQVGEEEKRIQVHALPLQQVTDEERESLFADPDTSLQRWAKLGSKVPADMYDAYTIKNTFYGDLHTLNLEPHSIDAVIADGPHGNGRSLAYPLLAPFLKPNAWILVDDFDHYPFLADLQRVFDYQEEYREIVGEKRWVLLQLTQRASSAKDERAGAKTMGTKKDETTASESKQDRTKEQKSTAEVMSSKKTNAAGEKQPGASVEPMSTGGSNLNRDKDKKNTAEVTSGKGPKAAAGESTTGQGMKSKTADAKESDASELSVSAGEATKKGKAEKGERGTKAGVTPETTGEVTSTCTTSTSKGKSCTTRSTTVEVEEVVPNAKLGGTCTTKEEGDELEVTKKVTLETKLKAESKGDPETGSKVLKKTTKLTQETKVANKDGAAADDDGEGDKADQGDKAGKADQAGKAAKDSGSAKADKAAKDSGSARADKTAKDGGSAKTDKTAKDGEADAVDTAGDEKAKDSSGASKFKRPWKS